MKWYSWLLIGILLGTIALVYLYDQSTIRTLNSRIASLESVRDTFFVEGTKDTIVKKDTVRIVVRVPVVKETLIDTLVDRNHHLIRLIASDSFFQADVKCMKPEITILKIDTVKVKEIVYREKHIPDTSIHWNEYLYGVGTGVIAVLITYIAIK